MKHPLSFQITNPHTGFFRCARHSGLLRALPAALICGFSAVAMAAEIHDAVRDGDAAAVSRLLKKDPKLVNLPDEDHAATPLHLAVDAGNLDLVRILLKAGASVTLKTDDGINKSNPADKLKIVKLLLAKGAKPNVKNLAGATPIDAAAKFGTPEILVTLKTHKPSSTGK